MADNKASFHREVITYFIIPSFCKGKADVNDTMKMAFQEAKEADLTPQWQKEADCNLENCSKNTVFVLQEFKGELFDKLRSTKSVRVCGPMCIRSCITEGLPIPENKSPVFTTAMRGVIVSASQIATATKMNIKDKVGFMGGIYVNNLLNSVTHLITNAVRSTKYEIACEKGIPVMTADWVDAVWEQSQKGNVKATDAELVARYRCPVFLNMFISCSNLPKKEKHEMEKLINQNGGTYTPQMRQTETTLLVISEPRGEKYKHARSWDLPCVLPSYIRDSVKCGYARPLKNYLLEAKVSCSTPTKDEDIPNFTYNSESSMSMINLETSKSHVDDTQLTNCSVASSCASHKRQTAKPPGRAYAAIIDELNVSEAKKAGSFVDGCRIFLSGFTSVEGEKLRRILSLGGATLFSELNDNVSHVIVGDFIVTDIKNLMALAQKPHTVTVEWVSASIKLMAPAHELSFYCLESQRVAPEPPSPLSQKGLQLLQPPQDVSEKSKMPPPAEPPVSRKLFSEFLNENTKSPAKPSAGTSMTSTSTASSEVSVLPEIFTGLTFVVIGFDDNAMANIESAVGDAGGTVVPANFTGVADYAVMPLQTEGVNITAVEVVTNLWLEDCLDSGEKLPLQYYHQPLSLDSDKKPLAGCCISLSNFFSKEKAFLIELVQLLGATYQDIFARVAKEHQGVLPSTHLVCPKPEGQKYAASIKWGVPAVTKDWLLACSRQGIKLPETNYFTNIQEKTLPIESEKKASTSNTPLQKTPSNTKSLATAVASSSCDLSQPATPASAVVHRTVSSLKRKSSAKTPDDLSPFHVSTPDTPYGQVFETPTAESKKRWKKFIDDFPSKAPSPPPPKKAPRRDSTPLSELKRKIWEIALQDAYDPANHTEGSENIQPRRLSAGRSTPSAKDFKSTSDTPRSQPRVLGKTQEQVKRSPANEIVCEMLGQLNERLSTPRLAPEEHQRPPPRELVEDNARSSTPQTVTANQQPESQPILVGWDDPVEAAHREKMNGNDSSPTSSSAEKQPRRFMLSNVREKPKYEELLKGIGEELSNEVDFDGRTTHLVVDEPLRSEKFLCCLAAGKWILHTSFIDHMVKNKKYVSDEEMFEWGNPASTGQLPPISPTGALARLACAGARWRKRQQDAAGMGPYKDMRAIIFATYPKDESYKRLIIAGGGQIVPLASFQQATHCFVEEKRIPTMPIPMAQFVSLKIPCLYPIFLSEMLVRDPPPSTLEGLIPEYRRLQSELKH